MVTHLPAKNLRRVADLLPGQSAFDQSMEIGGHDFAVPLEEGERSNRSTRSREERRDSMERRQAYERSQTGFIGRMLPTKAGPHTVKKARLVLNAYAERPLLALP